MTLPPDSRYISHAIMDAVLDPIFVLRHDEAISDCNQAACILLARPKLDILDQAARRLFSGWPDGAAALDFPDAETEIERPVNGRRRVYRVSVVSGRRGDDDQNWKILMFNDITGERELSEELSVLNASLELKVGERTESLRQEIELRKAAELDLLDINREMATTQKELLLTLSGVVESRSRETANHVTRVAELCRLLGKSLGLSGEAIETLVAAAPMHDVGKIAVPDAILSKPGPLTAEERSTMQLHTETGYRILHSSERPLLRAAAVIAREHHERWDGQGYPNGLAGEAISLNGRIVAICDVFDALINARVYKPAWPSDRVVEQLRQDRGTAFDPQLIDHFLENITVALIINERYQ